MTTILLAGGPAALDPVRTLPEGDFPAQLSVDHGRWHEHFVRTDGHDVVRGSLVRVFRWSYRTAIAE
ncbi:DUF5988 family protein [Amycolatopsis alba]|uniref:Uncharacterized protein n=1 Tax=Amycolatopsis alba DSM 44262 TaxID=1125972 RepID=A0A229RQB4_AMYAL|nr:DUF5988 family protein [Amycolatopsis alba]OXM48860.1 hypothetical protein CFP75_20595 [Amycolatopsis alba DSM 44262]